MIIFIEKRNAENEQATLSDKNIAAFLDHLVHERKVAASTQMQALNALVFFYRQVLQCKPGEAIEFTRAKRPKRLPVVLSRPGVTVTSSIDTLARISHQGAG
ncbi:MAG: hypothetical protein GY785_03670 [Gammaproteobacteria bacterium]|nr:hypothetical protein [Gammaproteobacteria bacterium]